MYTKNALLISIVWKDDARLVASHRGRAKGVLGEPSSTLRHALSGLLAVEDRKQNEMSPLLLTLTPPVFARFCVTLVVLLLTFSQLLTTCQAANSTAVPRSES